MNKAFTANINDQVTARGYLDENDQLIMLEPEGSGGGGCVALVNVQFVVSESLFVDAKMPGYMNDMYYAIVEGIESGNTYQVPLESLVTFGNASDTFDVSLSGQAEIFNDPDSGIYGIIVKGDCVITLTSN